MSDDSLLIIESDSEEGPQILDADPFHIEPMNVAIQAFEDEPPPLNQLAYDNEPLQTIAKHLEFLMTQEGNVKYNQKTRESLLKVITVFAYQSGKHAISASAPVQLPGTTPKVQNPEKQKEEPAISAREFKKLTQQLLRSQEELADCQHKYALAEQREQILRKEIHQLQQENDDLFKDKSQLLSKLQTTRREFDAIEGDLKQQLSKLKDDNSNYRDNLNQSSFAAERLQKQIASLNEELATATSQNNRLQTKLNSKIESMKQLRHKLHETEIQMHNTEAENEEFSIQIGDLTNKIDQLAQQLQDEGPDAFSKLKEDKSKLENALNIAVKHVEEQAAEIKKLNKINTQCYGIINRQTELIRPYDDYSDKIKEKAAEEQIQNNTLTAVPATTIQERSIPPMQAQSYVQPPRISPLTESYFNAIVDVLRPRFGDIANDQVLDIVTKLSKGTIDNEMTELNKRLMTLIENQLRFLYQMANNGALQLYLLSSDKADEIYMDQIPFRDQILVEIARCRSFLTLNKVDLPEHDITPTVAKTKLDKVDDSAELPQREAFDIAALQSANANIIRTLGEKLAEQNAQFIVGLTEIAKLINYDDKIETIMPVLVAKIKNFIACAKDCSEAEGEFDYNNFDESVKKIQSIYRKNAIVFKSLGAELQEITNYNGDIDKLPAHVHKYIQDLNKELENIIAARTKDLLTQAEEFDKKMEDEKALSTKNLAELEVKVQELEERNQDLNSANTKQMNEISSLKTNLQDVTERKEDFESKYNQLNENIKEMEGELQRMRTENSNLEAEMRKRDNNFEQRIMKALETERASHAQEVEITDKRMKDLQQKHEEQMAAKQALLRETKKKLKMVITTYDDAFKKQKNSMQALRQQNQTLVAKITSMTGNGGKNEPNDDAAKALAAEIQLLEMRLKQANEDAEKVASVKDTYWQSQVALVESQMMDNLQKKLEEAQKTHEQFVGAMIDEFQKYCSSIYDGTEESAMQIAKEVANKVETVEKQCAIAQKKADLILEQKRRMEQNQTDEIPKVVKMIKSLQTWEKWAKDMYSNASNRDAKDETPESLRAKLGDMIIISSAYGKVIGRLDSLRVQKKALLNHIGDIQPPNYMTPGAFAKIVLFAVRVSKLGCKTVAFIPSSI